MIGARAAAAALAAALVAAPAAAPAAPGRFVPGEVLVRFREGTPAPRAAAAIARLAHVPVRDVGGGFVHVRVRPDETVEAALAAYALDPAVEWAQPNYVYRALASPDDREYTDGNQWALKNFGQTISPPLQPGDSLFSPTRGTSGDDVDAERAWDLVTDCSSVVVAVVDTGVNYAHPDLAANMWVDPDGVLTLHGTDVVDGDDDPMDLNGHGTHVAGIVGAVGNNATGVSGVCWKASLMAVRALDAAGSGSTATIVAGVRFAAAHGARVINLSLGFAGSDPAVASAVSAATAAGAVVVAAAGNDGVNDDGPDATYPCADPDPGVLCVAAVDATFALASFSNYGATTVDVAAPGVNVVATWPGRHTAQTLAHGTGAAFTSTWNPTSTTGTGFATVTEGGVTWLVDPAAYFLSATARYRAGTLDRIYRTIDTSGADAATVSFGAAVDLASADWLRAWCSPAGGPPWSAVTLGEEQGLVTGGQLIGFELDLTRCMTAGTTLGIELQSTGTASSWGIAATPMELRKLTLNPPQPQYDTLSGTSMAAPVAAGVAALVLAYQPAFTPVDVVGAVAGGGRRVAALATKTSSGNVVQAYGALRYVNPPRGFTATIHQEP